MCTGVLSTVILDRRPAPEVLNAAAVGSDRVVKIADLHDGRVQVSCFTPLRCDHPSLLDALREVSLSQRRDLDSMKVV